MPGNILFVGHQDDGIALGVDLIQQAHDIPRSLGIEVPSGLICQDDRRFIHQCPGHCHSLPLSARFGVVSLHVAPEYRRTRAEVVYGSDPLASETWGSIGYLRSGLLVDTGRLSVGASAALRSTRFAEGLSLDLPFQAGIEAHWIIPQSSVALTAFAAGEFDSERDFYAIGGLGIGVLF